MRRAPFTPPAMRGALAWAGLVLMIASGLWLDSLPREREPITSLRSQSAEPFPVVVIDPGHGGQDSGAMCAGMLEKDLTLDVAQRLERRLQTQGLATVMTRVGDGYISLADRAALTNRVPDCVLVSIHFNEGNKPVSSGIETYYAEYQMGASQPVVSWLPFLQRVAAEIPNEESQSLAAFVQDALVSHTHALNRGTKVQQFFVLANVRHPAVLVEGGFMTNKEDVAKLTDVGYREEIAAAIGDGIIRYRDLLKERHVVRPAPAAD
jgi:N-acetylmuramoyl-L-alanine amidase